MYDLCHEEGSIPFMGNVSFKASALWANAFYKSICLYVCPPVCSLFEVPFKHLFAPTSRILMSKIFRFLESLRKSNGKKWSQLWKKMAYKGCKIAAQKKLFFFGKFCLTIRIFCIGANICIGQEMLCLRYSGFF